MEMVRFADFKNAVKQTSVFWALVNQPPPTFQQGTCEGPVSAGERSDT
jgi:hypothetical protein